MIGKLSENRNAHYAFQMSPSWFFLRASYATRACISTLMKAWKASP
jgi:hypothetical protein